MFEHLVSQMLDFPQKIKKVYMHGTGESTLNPHLADMIAFLKHKNAAEYIDLTTNGILLTEKLINELIDSGLDHLHISIEALSTEQYTEITGVNTVIFEQLVEKIQMLSQQRKKCRLSIKIANISLKSQDDKKCFINKFSPLCDEIFIENIFPIWPGFTMPNLPIANTQGNGQYGELRTDKNVCPQIFTTLAVKCDGSVSPCSMDWNNQIVLGNFLDKPLLEMWQGSDLRELRLQHLQMGRKHVNLCMGCGLPENSCIDNIDAYRDELTEKLSELG